MDDTEEEDFLAPITPYTLVHGFVGFLAGKMKMPLEYWVVIHIIFEIFENSPVGIEFYKNGNFLFFGKGWPSYKGDWVINSQFDTFSCGCRMDAR